MNKLKKNTTFKDGRVDVLSESKFLHEKDVVKTKIPAINIAFSANPEGGYSSGLTMIAGPSKHFKTAFGLLMMKAYLDKYEDGIALFYDSEFGTPQAYFDTFDIDTSRVVHVPVTDLEELKFDIMSQLKEVTPEDHLFVMVDSVGNLASKKEVEDAENQKSAADMTRAKQFKSLFRMVTPHLSMKDLPMVAINHTYDSQGLFPTKVVSGGTGMYYSADNIWIVGRQQEKDGADLAGYNFVINVEKSRYVKEKSKIPIQVKFEGGIDKWSGITDMAISAGLIIKESGGWYRTVNVETGEIAEKKVRAKELDASVFNPIIESQMFKDWVSNTYKIGSSKIMEDE
jgi:RecA/RadA recombinase